MSGYSTDFGLLDMYVSLLDVLTWTMWLFYFPGLNGYSTDFALWDMYVSLFDVLTWAMS